MGTSVLGAVLVRLGDSRAGAPLDRLKRVLLSALQTAFYRTALERAGLGAPSAIRAVVTVEEALAGLPATRLADWQHCRGLFENRRVWRWWPAARRRPRARGVLMASSEWLLEMVRAGSVPRVEHSVIALTPFGRRPLSEEDRDLLWRGFRVPLFERLLGPDGQPFAAECPAHQELHVLGDWAVLESSGGELLVTSLTSLRFPALRVASGLNGRLRNGRCGCGESVLRVGTD